MPSFSYPPLTAGLDAIRVLKLSPGGFSEPLVGTLTPVLFSDKPKYVALSYTWGFSYPDNSKLPISYHESTRDGGYLTLNNEPLWVGHNLYLALLHLRSLTHPITLWVDAICINQEDTNERNQQVSLMAFTFTRAIKVISWVGTRRYPNTMGIFHSMSLESKVRQTRHLAATLATESPMRYSPSPTESTVLRIAESAYWSRLWIIQEVCIPRLLVLVYGSEIWTYDDFKQLIPAPTDQTQSQNTPDVFTPMRKLFETREKRHTEIMRLETLVERFTDSKCLELKDRVFGLLGCANDVRPYTENDINFKETSMARESPHPFNPPLPISQGVIGSLIVNYSSTFYQIWLNVVKLFFRAKSIKSRFETRFHTLPETAGTQTEIILNEERAISIVRTAGMLQVALNQKVEEEVVRANCIVNDPTMIRAVGYIAGKILRLGPENSSLIASSRVQQDWTSSWLEVYEKEEDMEVLRRIGEDYTAKLLNFKESDIGRVRNILNTEVTAWPATLKETAPEHSEHKETRVNTPAENRQPRICLGTGYLMGLVPSAAKPGDIIVRFWDCDAAIVMRPTKTTSTPGYDLRAEQCMLSSIVPGFIKDVPGHFGAIYVSLDLHTLQMITAYIAT
ncbi:heterokaryon incompatibility protein-domain-containing protein [Xylaria arbuscula]|nr:heterokaryon incompatibility protein-domain-containing protein [Xylaria arbuscula]